MDGTFGGPPNLGWTHHRSEKWPNLDRLIRPLAIYSYDALPPPGGFQNRALQPEAETFMAVAIPLARVLSHQVSRKCRSQHGAEQAEVTRTAHMNGIRVAHRTTQS